MPGGGRGRAALGGSGGACQLVDFSTFRLLDLLGSWRVGKLAGRPEEVIARCSDCIVLSPLPAGCDGVIGGFLVYPEVRERTQRAQGAGCRQDGRQGCGGGVAALGGQGAGTEKRGGGSGAAG